MSPMETVPSGPAQGGAMDRAPLARLKENVCDPSLDLDPMKLRSKLIDALKPYSDIPEAAKERAGLIDRASRGL
jgi:hypothetical protein